MSGVWEQSRFEDGRELVIDVDPYLQPAVVTIDGARVIVGRVTRYRDGGTTVLDTSAGRIVCPRALGSTDRTPTISW
jgi:hypothetical protein